MTLLPHSISQAWLLIVLLLWVLGMRLSASTTDELEQLLVDAFIEAMHRAGLTFKEMAYAMRRGHQDKFDEAQLRRQLALEPGQHLSLFRLLGAPLSWWMFFGPSLIAIVFRKRLAEVREEAEAMRADLKAAIKRTVA
jgi:hypothetical protein